MSADDFIDVEFTVVDERPAQQRGTDPQSALDLFDELVERSKAAIVIPGIQTPPDAPNPQG